MYTMVPTAYFVTSQNHLYLKFGLVYKYVCNSLKVSLSIVNSLRSACATVAPFNLCIILTRKRVWSRSGADELEIIASKVKVIRFS